VTLNQGTLELVGSTFTGNLGGNSSSAVRLSNILDQPITIKNCKFEKNSGAFAFLEDGLPFKDLIAQKIFPLNYFPYFDESNEQLFINEVCSSELAVIGQQENCEEE